MEFDEDLDDESGGCGWPVHVEWSIYTLGLEVEPEDIPVMDEDNETVPHLSDGDSRSGSEASMPEWRGHGLCTKNPNKTIYKKDLEQRLYIFSLHGFSYGQDTNNISMLWIGDMLSTLYGKRHESNGTYHLTAHWSQWHHSGMDASYVVWS